MICTNWLEFSGAEEQLHIVTARQSGKPRIDCVPEFTGDHTAMENL